MRTKRSPKGCRRRAPQASQQDFSQPWLSFTGDQPTPLNTRVQTHPSWSDSRRLNSVFRKSVSTLISSCARISSIISNPNSTTESSWLKMTSESSSRIEPQSNRIPRSQDLRPLKRKKTSLTTSRVLFKRTLSRWSTSNRKFRLQSARCCV